MSAVKLNTAGGGSVLVQPASSIASDVTVNVPSQNCTLGIQGPAFSAYQSSAQSISNNTATKVQFQTEEFDTNSCFDSATNYRFTPTISGYYQVNGATSSGAALGFNFCSIYKNGSEFKRGTQSGSGGTLQNVVSSIVYFNGSTDYVELYTLQASGSSQNLQALAFTTYFQASMVRAA